MANFEFILSSKNYDIILVTESWLHENIPNSIICPDPDYNVFRSDRSSTGGGVALFINKAIAVLPVQCNKLCGIEILAVDIMDISNSKIRIILVYFPPKFSNNSSVMAKLCNELFILASVDYQVLITGDFNLPKINWDTPNGITVADSFFVEFISSLNLIQHVKFPTRGQNILDLLLTNQENSIQNLIHLPPFQKSDHFSLNFKICFKLAKSENKCVRNFFKGDYDRLNHYFLNVNWSEILYRFSDLDSIYSAFCQVVYWGIEECIPFIAPSSNKLRYPCHINKIMEYRNKIWPFISDDSTLKKFQLASKKLSSEIVKFHRYIERKKYLKHGKSFFNFISRKVKPKNCAIPSILQNDLPIFDNVQKANIFASYFKSLSDNAFPAMKFSAKKLPQNFITNVYISDSEMFDLLEKLPSKNNTSPDGIPNILLKKCAVSLAYPLACICRLSLSKGLVPTAWKSAIIKPLLKKGNPSLVQNYRPISLTCSISKATESFIKQKLELFFDQNNIIPDSQHGFRSAKGVTTQMLEAVDDWSIALERKNCVDVIYFDIAKAFNSISHERLIDKLYHSGVRGQLLCWIKDFLAQNSFMVNIDDSFSDQKHIKSGVPQGSVLGPLLFNFYMHDILQGKSFPQVNIKFFADDLKAYVEFDPERDPNYRSKLQDFINYFDYWCTLNGLSIAASKCNVLHMGIRNPKLNYYLDNDNPIPQTFQVRDLGIYVTSDLKWASHIKIKSRAANAKFFSIFKAFKSNDPKFLTSLYVSYVRPILEFASPVFNTDCIGNINALEAVQKRITRAIFRRCFLKTYPTPPPYETRLAILNLEKLNTRAIKNDLVVAFKYMQGLVKCNSKNAPVFHNAKFKRNRFEIYIPTPRIKVRENSFFVRAIKLFTKLKPDIIKSSSVNSFRNKINKSKIDSLFNAKLSAHL